MGSIPVANPAPYQRPHISRRGLLAFALPLALIALIVTVVAFVWPEGGRPAPPPLLDAGAVEDLPVNEPTRILEGRFWLVKLESGEVLALSQRSTHLGCTVPWRSEFEFQGRKGWFRDPCSGATWDIDGTLVFGPAFRGLDRHPLRIEYGRILVDTSTLICGPGALVPRDGCVMSAAVPAQ
jgi:cytochrome b6-f complex iron-sulfur subunit